jgi:hypothetical protein
VDAVSEAYQFSASDLENPAKFKSSQPAVPQQGTLDHIWTDVQDNFRIPLGRSTKCIQSHALRGAVDI